MTEATFDHPEPWTEAEYLALGETSSRIELVDGGLWVSPAGNIAHQRISDIIVRLLHPAALAANLNVVSAINVRLATGRILIPDVVVGAIDRQGITVEASKIEMVVEIVSPSCVTGVVLRLLHRRGGEYDETSVAEHGDTLRSERPFPIEVDTTALLDF
ncbi:Uma2 family endonuclease [Actinoplanes sp. NPDC048796]|uniref:Uma2 family endonuclease n=1 Tax=Actinoplanes sp. NPDC048796 TaxID=3155640 RepID=UPI0033D8C17B